jgi:uncharacterized protein (DUF305 family)
VTGPTVCGACRKAADAAHPICHVEGTIRMSRVPKAFSAPILAAAVLGLSACGSSNTSAGQHMSAMGSPSTAPTTAVPSQASDRAATGPHNLADVDFATAMIPHHAQAIEMAGLVLKRTKNAQVTDLATDIKAAQSPEIATLSGWLTGWGAPVPDTSESMGAGMTMEGMMSDSDLKELETAPVAKVDALFLTQMSEHHRGAIAMAEEELASGSNPQAKELAQSIKRAQTAQVSEMKSLLASIN